MGTHREEPNDSHGQQQGEAGPGEAGVSRRRMIVGAAGIGAASGLVAGGLGGTANATPLAGQNARPADSAARQDGPIVAHLNDVRDGTVDLYYGEQETSVHSPELAHALARAAARGR
jgi:hypothetical protein